MLAKYHDEQMRVGCLLDEHLGTYPKFPRDVNYDGVEVTNKEIESWQRAKF